MDLRPRLLRRCVSFLPPGRRGDVRLVQRAWDQAIGCMPLCTEFAFYKRCADGDVRGVAFAIRNGINIHMDDDWGLRVAVRFGREEVVRLLLKHGANVNACNKEAFWLSEGKHPVIAEMLKKHAVLHESNHVGALRGD